MTQQELNQADAEATGESVETIATLGFSLEPPPDIMNNPLPIHEKPNTSDIRKANRQPYACPAA